jgi:2-phosphosulfolactate phosphatase
MATMIHWHCHDVFHRMPAGATAGGIAVVIDVLRASTTMITALAHGAASVLPVADVDEARRLAGELGQRALLGGERGGLRIPGFDLGNSPREYTAGRVAGQTVVITTTNGTAALHASRDAAEIVVGAIVNRTAVAEAVRRLAGNRGVVHLVCAGTDGAVTEEDILAAGAILDAAGATRLDAAAAAARERFRETIRGATDPCIPLAAALANSRGGRNLLAIGMKADIGDAAAIDTIPVVPRLDRGSGWFHVDR